MVTSNVRYAKEFEQCEQENLRQTGAFQYGMHVLVFKENQMVGFSEGVDEKLKARAQAVLPLTGEKFADGPHEIIKDSSGGLWLKHNNNGYTFLEFSENKNANPIVDKQYLNELDNLDVANVWKCADHVCQFVADNIDAERIMIYQFHEDWSGEVISERIAEGTESFLGLRYPPTDIPKIARNLYFALKTRHLFNVEPATALVVEPENIDAKDIDLSFCLSRSISPFHIEYLKNMGSASTLSCAIIVEDKLWGLLSLHFAEKRTVDINEFVYFQQMASGLNKAFERAIHEQQKIMTMRSQNAVNRLMQKVEEEVEPFQTLILSDVALHKLSGGQGISLFIGNEISSLGNIPKQNELLKMRDHLANGFEVGCYFYEQSPFAFKLSNNVAGMAIYILSNAPFCAIVIYRKGLNQTVTWGGDPRHYAQEEDGVLRYTPRQSFNKWVENVEGRSAPWSVQHKEAIEKAFEGVKAFLEVDNPELAILLRSGMRRALKKRENLRSVATDVIDSITSGIAIGIEQGATSSNAVVAINNVTAESFNISHSDFLGASFDEFSNSIGLDWDKSVGADNPITINTAINGIRDVTVRQGLLFEYFDIACPKESLMRLVIYEFIDITEATRIKNSLIAAREKAITENNLRNEMMAKLFHELKTPLHGLLGLSDIMRKRFEVNDDFKNKALMDSLHQSASLMRDVVEYSLKSSSLVDTVDERNFRRLSINKLIKEIATLVQPLADKKQVSIDTELGSDICVNIEPRGIRQVLINLIENAIKYNIEGGSVKISTELSDYGRMSIVVEDTGNGMTTEQINKCTQPYQRFSNLDGSGLGLSIAEALMRNMGGQFEISSKVGVGTKITVSMGAESDIAA
ncbi:ATP-binding protein [Alteromonas gracilis]|uniref:ATP-binding protein n=1 Tax=Alteromonas gracilis TaxID=1479524 RepID=UPI003735F147